MRAFFGILATITACFALQAQALDLDLDPKNPCVCHDAWHSDEGPYLAVPKDLSSAMCSYDEQRGSMMVINQGDLFSMDVLTNKKGELTNTVCMGISLNNGYLSRSFSSDPKKEDISLCKSFMESRGCNFPILPKR